jgi:hypothetical protein
MVNLCRYKDIFGEPNTGVHAYRIGNIAIVDVILTLLLAWFLSRISRVRLIYWIILLFVLGIIVHRMFCVRTTIDQLLF